MLSSLLDDDSERYNIPVVVRQFLRLLAKGQVMLEHRDSDVRVHFAETRESLSEWSKYTSLLESDMRDRIIKLEDATERIDHSQSEKAESLQKQITLATKDRESLYHQFVSLEKSHRASRVEFLDSLDAHRLELNSEIDSRLKGFSANLFSRVIVFTTLLC